LNSRRKGKAGELEAAHLMMRLGFHARRSVQYNGQAGDADLATNLRGVHVEVKYTERLSPYAFIDQAVRDSRGRALPVVLMRSTRRPWLVCCRADDLWSLIDAAIQARSTIQQDDAQGQQAQGPVVDQPTP